MKKWREKRLRSLPVFFALALCAVVLTLTGCGTEKTAQDTALLSEETESESRFVRFLLDGKVLAEKEYPQAPDLEVLQKEVPELRLSSVEAGKDRVILAYCYPRLNAEAVYLFADEEGFLYPNSPLSSRDLMLALACLSGDQPEGISETDESGPVDYGTLRTALLAFFSEEELDALSVENDRSRGPTREEFAALLNALIGRTGNRILPESGAKAAVDLDCSQESYRDLLDASVPHRLDENGQVWEAIPLSGCRSPGAHLRADGRTFFCDEKGFLLRDTKVGKLYFDQDGFYTSGDPELDGAVTEILAGIRQENPKAEQAELLRCVYDYMLTHFQYVGGRLYPANTTGWEIEEAKKMLDRGLGNCFCYAGAFWALTRGLGYGTESRCKNLDPDYAHAWNDIPFDGVYYIFDPCLEQMKKNDRYMLTYEEAAQYWYPPLSPAEKEGAYT